jgi:23S rRNA (cytidine2498-2'-O)-methyltransferase
MPRFAFAVVQPGIEPWLRALVADSAPSLRPAYARPGLVTWKRTESTESMLPPRPALARVWGEGLGLAEHVEEVLALAPEGPLRLHVFARDARPRRRGSDIEPDAEGKVRALELEAELRSRRSFLDGPVAANGDRVLDVVVGGRDPMYVGWHVHGPDAVAWPGGRIPVEVPPDAPSRAYRKLEEVLAWSRLPIAPGDVAVEIGASPGGAALALVRRGVEVVAIDPAPLAGAVVAYVGPGGARVRHLACAVGGVRREDLPRGARWLLSDVNLAPPVAFRYLARIAAKLGPSVRGVLWTAKLNDARMASAIPSFVRRVGELGMREVRAIQLPAHRRELAIVGWR